ncbi:MAG: hypothetical protein ACRDEA_13355 [Microcystaceae cyanobacterium]
MTAFSTLLGLVPLTASAQAQEIKMGVPDGYFVRNGTTVYARSGGAICGFSRPGQLDIYRRVYPAPNVPVPNPGSYQSAGICSTPAAFFTFENTVYYSFGNGKFCGFPTPASLTVYKSFYNRPDVGRIKSKPGEFMSYMGVCPDPNR